jgi:hypothetical protein
MFQQLVCVIMKLSLSLPHLLELPRCYGNLWFTIAIGFYTEALRYDPQKYELCWSVMLCVSITYVVPHMLYRLTPLYTLYAVTCHLLDYVYRFLERIYQALYRLAPVSVAERSEACTYRLRWLGRRDRIPLRTWMFGVCVCARVFLCMCCPVFR